MVEGEEIHVIFAIEYFEVVVGEWIEGRRIVCTGR